MLGQEVGGDTAAEKTASLREHERLVSVHAGSLRQAQPLQSNECVAVERPVQALEPQRLVQPEPEQQPLRAPDAVVEWLQLALRTAAPGESSDVGRETRRVPPPQALNCRDG